MNNEYNFRINLSGRGSRKYKCNTKIRLSDENVKVNCEESYERVIKPVKDSNGVYNLSAIKKVGYGHFIAIFKGPFIATILITIIVILMTIMDGIIMANIIINIILIAMYLICCKITTIKLVLKDGKKVHIPVKALSYENIEAKENAKEIIKMIQEKLIY